MKKTMKILLDKVHQLEETKDGKLQGGFAFIKGGFNSDNFSTNDTPTGCSNTVDCTHSTNLQTCSNTGHCFF